MTEIEDDEFRREVCDWLRLNGVDPGEIPASALMVKAGDQLTFHRLVRNRQTGAVTPDPSGPYMPLTEVVTVQLSVQPPPDVAEWLRPKCSTCGR